LAQAILAQVLYPPSENSPAPPSKFSVAAAMLSRTSFLAFGAATIEARPIHERSLLQLSESSVATPIARVTNLLKEMQSTLNKDMEEDEGLFDKMKCWCANGAGEKAAEIDASKAKITQLEQTIESLTARTSGELAVEIKDHEAEVAADKNALDEAAGIRAKQLEEFQNMEDDSVQAIENMKAAVTVLAKHQDDGFLQSKVSLLSIGRKEQPFTDDIFDSIGDNIAPVRNTRKAQGKTGFLQPDEHAATVSMDDATVVRTALKSANAFLQSRGHEAYMPSYESKSGEIVGVMKTMMEEMHSDLAEAQKTEAERVVSFVELKKAKTQQIADGEAMAEKKEDLLAGGANELAEAKEDLGQEEKALEEAEHFVKNLDKMCADADSAFAERKQSRMDEIKAVGETIGILTSDEARDTISKTYNFAQVASHSQRKQARSKAAATLRKAALESRDDNLALLATTVELDAFTKVKKAIDDMVAVLKIEQADEVKKNDWCKESIQESDMTTMKTNDRLGDLQANEAAIKESIMALEKGIIAAQNAVSETRVNFQRASEDRKAENLEFQTTISDQATTVSILKKALNKLATFYDSEFLQAHQTPPVPQAEYKPNAGASGVMQMIEKLVQDAYKMTADATKSENEAQAAYEALVTDTNDSVDALNKEIVTKGKNKVQAKKDLAQTERDIMDTVNELEGLSKENANLHKECDYVLKNFDVRQKARGEEIEALAQAKSILNGAN